MVGEWDVMYHQQVGGNDLEEYGLNPLSSL